MPINNHYNITIEGFFVSDRSPKEFTKKVHFKFTC